jgi:DNA-binding winged helix-turn-helix (wHTH) protein
VLASLVERPGQNVTPEELQELIWPKDTFFDFDHSLHKAVNRLRSTLNDNPGQPRYIETIPRRDTALLRTVTGVARGQDES